MKSGFRDLGASRGCFGGWGGGPEKFLNQDPERQTLQLKPQPRKATN